MNIYTCSMRISFPAMAQVSFGDVGTVYQLLDQCGAERVSENYETEGPTDVVMTVRVEVTEVQGLIESAVNATSGRVTLKRV